MKDTGENKNKWHYLRHKQKKRKKKRKKKDKLIQPTSKPLNS